MHALQVFVWYRLRSGGIIGQYFFEKQKGATITINENTCCTKIADFFVPALYGINVNDVC